MIWRDETLDAALIEVSEPLPPDVADVRWSERLPAEDSRWISTGYPEAAELGGDGGERERKTAGFDGTLYVKGGRGQGSQYLELGVNFPPDKKKDWSGVCMPRLCWRGTPRNFEVGGFRRKSTLRRACVGPPSRPRASKRDEAQMA